MLTSLNRSRARAAVVALAVVVATAGCHKSETAAEPEIVVAVKVVKADRGDVSESVTAVGTVTAKAEAIVSPKVGAAIAEMGILKDRAVGTGDVIAVLESRDLRAAAAESDFAVREADATLRQTAGGTNPEGTAQKDREVRDAEAKLRQADALFRRRQVLFDKGGIPKKELEDAEAQLKQTQNELALARREASLSATNLNPTNTEIAQTKLSQAKQRAANAHAQVGYTIVKSPISGIITEQAHQKGDFVAAGEKIVVVSDISQIVIKAQFPDVSIAGVETGAEAEIQPSSGQEEPMFGTVQLVSRTVDPASRTVEVWISAVNEANRLRPGEFAKVTITTEEAKNAVLVPPAAVTFDDPTEDKGKVVVVDTTNVAHEVEVTVGVRGDEAYEITEGLLGGETVVVEGNYALPDGTKVNPVEAEPPGGKEEEAAEPGAKAEP